MNCARRLHCSPGWKKNKDLKVHLTQLSSHISICVLSTASVGSKQSVSVPGIPDWNISLWPTLTLFLSKYRHVLGIKCSSLEFGDIFYLWPLAVNMSLPPLDALSSLPWLTQPPLPNQNVLCGLFFVRTFLPSGVFLNPPLLCVCAVLLTLPEFQITDPCWKTERMVSKYISDILFVYMPALGFFSQRLIWQKSKVNGVFILSHSFVTYSAFLWGHQKCCDLSWVLGDISRNEHFSLWWKCLFWIFTL